MVVTKAKEKEQIVSNEFLKCFTQDKQNTEFALSRGYLPVTKEANKI